MKKKIGVATPKKAKKENKEEFKYKLTISIGEGTGLKEYKFDTNDIVKTLLNTGIVDIDYWTKIKVESNETGRIFEETLNVPKAKNVLTNQNFAEYITSNIKINID